MMKLTLKTVDGDIVIREATMSVEERPAFTGEQLLMKFSEKVSDLMCSMTEQIIRSLVPDGVHAGTWARKHSLSVGIRKVRSGMKHMVIKDGEVVGEVAYRDGKVTSRVFIGRGYISES